MTDYAELRAAVAQNCHALLIDDPDTIRALLAERDALREALQGLLDALPSATTHPAIQAARAALAQAQEQGD